MTRRRFLPAAAPGPPPGRVAQEERPAQPEGKGNAADVRLGLRENAGQFALLVLVNAFVGAMVGVERSVLPLLAERRFGVASATAALGFLVAFGLAKSAANLVAGNLATRVGRRRILLAGWIAALPVPLLLWWAPSWGWVVAANLFLGVNQGLAWSATVIMKIDLVGPRRRGLAMGLNEFAGYLAVALSALGGGLLAAEHGPRAALLWISGGASAAGLVLTLLLVRDTAAHVELEHALAAGVERGAAEPRKGARAGGTGRPLFAANQAGLVNNLNDGVAWGVFPLYFAQAGLSLRQVAWLAALYPAVWGIAQLGTGALSDRSGRRIPITAGMLLQAAALAMFAAGGGMEWYAGAAVLLGVGTAAVYPTLIAQVSDLVPPRERARAVGAYRLWRDLGYVAGALLAGIVSDRLGFRAAIGTVAALTALSGLVALWLLPRGAVSSAPSRLAHRAHE